MLEKNPNYDLMETNEQNKNARGGTELLQDRLYSSLPRSLLENFQIYLSRVASPLKTDKIRLFWAHDLAGDPEAEKALGNENWKKFHRIVFVSNWQMQTYMGKFNIPWSRCIVMQNSIVPIDKVEKKVEDKIKFVYYSNPIKGLAILVPVFVKLAENHPNIELNVYSSFDLYGWNDRDQQVKPLLDQCIAHPNINYYKSIPNEGIREVLKTQHIFAYPSLWEETSCLALMEAMSAGLICLHPNYGALFETAANFSWQYQYHEDPNRHAGMFYTILETMLSSDFNFSSFDSRLTSQKNYADTFYNWNMKQKEWEAFLTSLLQEPRGLPKSDTFSYKF